MLTVDEEFILEAYKEACDKWKLKLEEKFPNLLFNYKNLTEYQDLINKKVTSYELTREDKRGNIFICLPNFNVEWTRLAFKLAIVIADTGRYYIDHTKYTNDIFPDNFSLCLNKRN